MKFLAVLLWIQMALAASDKVIVGYYTEWTQWSFPPSSIPYSKLTHINYAFALFTEPWLNPAVSYPDLLNQVVSQAHQNGVKVLVSIGGWTGSKYFSSMAADATKRTLFINNLVAMMQRHNLDGIDLDWEFPGQPGEVGNIVDVANDTNNFLKLLQEMRQKFGSKLITAAVFTSTFNGPQGPIKDASEFANVFDFVNIMSYEMNGAWSPTTGPLAGLDYEKGKGAQQSVRNCVNSWLNAKFPADKIVVGVPFYGYSVKTKQDMTNTDQYVPIHPGTGEVVPYHAMFSKGALVSPNQANGNNGWIRKVDPITKTPWLFNKNTNQFISYDDVQSLTVKSEYVRCNKFRGFMVWAIDQDYQSQLINTLQSLHQPINQCPTDPTTPEPTPTDPTSPPKPTFPCKDGGANECYQDGRKHRKCTA